MKKTFLNCAGLELSFEEPKLMGVINLDPGSFYDGSHAMNEGLFLSKTEDMIEEGADVIDVGATTTRPGASLSVPNDEIVKLKPLIKRFKKEWPEVILSIDTYHSEVARVCIEEGANMINDVSAGNIDGHLMEICGQYNLPYVLMHMKGMPSTMQSDTKYHNLVEDVLNFFKLKIEECNKKGIKQLILDPGIGFGKSLEGNYTILKKMINFKSLNYPLLMGLSRKSLIQNLINVSADEALNGTTALHILALENGADMLRVHDVKAAKETINIWNYYTSL